MALAGPMVVPQPGSPHLEYLWWDLMQRRALVWALAECIGVTIERPTCPVLVPADDPTGRQVGSTPSAVGRQSAIGQQSAIAPMLMMLEDSLAQMAPGTGIARYQHQTTALLAACATQTDAVGPELDRATAAEWGAVLGRPVDDLRAAAADMERFVRTAGPEFDTALAQCFARQVERMVFALEPVADRVRGYDLVPVDL